MPEPAPAAAHRSKLTGRAALLVLVMAVLTVSYGSSLKAYIQQRAHINELKTTIAQREADISALQREKDRWQDPAFVQAQARARFGYVLPGETSYVVLGADGQPLADSATLADPARVVKQHPTAWWSPAWESVKLAGLPPAARNAKPPATEIDGTKKQ